MLAEGRKKEKKKRRQCLIQKEEREASEKTVERTIRLTLNQLQPMSCFYCSKTLWLLCDFISTSVCVRRKSNTKLSYIYSRKKRRTKIYAPILPICLRWHVVFQLFCVAAKHQPQSQRSSWRCSYFMLNEITWHSTYKAAWILTQRYTAVVFPLFFHLVEPKARRAKLHAKQKEKVNSKMRK